MGWKLTDNFRGKFRRIGHPGKTGANHPCWKGGRIIDRDGYVRTWAPNHPWPRKGYLLEHIRVVELSLGRRLLPSECVHHKDHDKKNNALENLEILNRGAHSKMHRGKGDWKTFSRDSKGRFVCGSI